MLAVHVKTAAKSLSLNVNRTTTISGLKDIVAQKEGMQKNDQRVSSNISKMRVQL